MRMLPAIGTEADPTPFDVSWTSPSLDARGAMPLGSGNESASVWVSPAGDIMAYGVKSDAVDELTSRDKVALLRVRFDPPLSTTAGFSQRLYLKNASVVITTADVRAVAFVDANAPALRLKAWSRRHGASFRLSATLHVWRNATARGLGVNDSTYFCRAWNRSADVLLPATLLPGGGSVGVAHVNGVRTPDALFRSTLAAQGIALPADGTGLALNPARGRVFGAVLSGTAASPMVRLNESAVTSSAAATRQELLLTMLTTVDKPLPGWAAQALGLSRTLGAERFSAAAAAHASVWRDLWQRSYVRVAPPATSRSGVGPTESSSVAGDPSAVATLQRYLDLSGGRQAGLPIGHGGQSWGVNGRSTPYGREPACAEPSNSGVCSPDSYAWWTWYWQEGRHPYYSALPAGDGADLLPAWFRLYLATLPVSIARARSWYNISGAAFLERFTLLGTYDAATYGCSTPPAQPDAMVNLWQKYHIVGSLMLCNLGLDDYAFHGDEERLRTFALPICLNAEETWHCLDPTNRSLCVTNPASDVAALIIVTKRLLELPQLDAEQRATVQALRARVPPLPRGRRPYPPAPLPSSEEVYLPADAVGNVENHNIENVELHAIFPLRLTHVGEDDALMDLGLARRTYDKRMFRCSPNPADGAPWSAPWCEDGNVAAHLGLSEEAAQAVLSSVSIANTAGWRFPNFHAGGGDTTPTMMDGQILRQTLHAMMLQSNRRGELLLFPAWPDGWDAAFKLHAPRRTLVEARCVNGSLVRLDVTPAHRRADVRLVGCRRGARSANAHDDPRPGHQGVR